MGRIRVLVAALSLIAGTEQSLADTCTAKTPREQCKHRVAQDHRKLMAGAAVAVRDQGRCGEVGTMGVFLRDGEKRSYLLSNTHVLACFNDGRLNVGTETCVREEKEKPKQKGQCVWHPSNPSADLARRYVVGILTTFVPIGVFDERRQPKINTYDAAVARLVDGIRTDGGVIDLKGLPSAEVADPTEKTILCKSGGTTGLTCGMVIADEEARPKEKGGPVKVGVLQFDPKTTVFLRALTAAEIRDKLPKELHPPAPQPQEPPIPLVSKGDSGSVFFVVLGPDGKLLDHPKPAALVYGGNEKDRAFAHPMKGVLGALETELAIAAGTLKVVDGPPPKD